MISILTKFRDEEQEHHDIGLAEGAENAPAFQAMKFIIKSGCQVAIAISEKYWYRNQTEIFLMFWP